MSTRLENIDLLDFTGGLNLRDGQFQLAENESPNMLNMEVDPRAGFFTRAGWRRWNTSDIADPLDWNPRHAELSPLSTGSFVTYITNDLDDGEIYAATAGGVFDNLSITCNANPHLADFATWGDTTYIATGAAAADIGSTPYRVVGTNAPAPLADASLGFNDNYTIPLKGRMPFAEYAEPHASYLFVGGTREQDGFHPNRIRWSHPDEPEDWATNDFIDIEIGGGRITALHSFQDHLVIFKTDSVWALYGYNLESWQLVKMSRSIGAPSPTAVARNESSLFFFSASGRNGIYAYDGNQLTEISLPIRGAMEEITRFEDVWIGWAGRRLWCSVPWAPDTVGGDGVLVWDPDVGNGAWVFHQPALGSLRCIIERADIESGYPAGVIHGDSGAAAVVFLDYDPSSASDVLLEGFTLTPFPAEYTTGWKHNGWPERRKSWLRSRWVARRPDAAVRIRLDVFKDYETSNPARSSAGIIDSAGTVFWRELGFDDPAGDGFDFTELGAADPSGRGADFTGGAQGSNIGRSLSGFGPARAIQIKLSSDAASPTYGQPWGFDGIFIKFNMRRFTT